MKHNISTNRRAVLKTSGLITASVKWTAPVISVISLPAHAQTSACNGPITVNLVFSDAAANFTFGVDDSSCTLNSNAGVEVSGISGNGSTASFSYIDSRNTIFPVSVDTGMTTNSLFIVSGSTGLTWDGTLDISYDGGAREFTITGSLSAA